MALSSQNQAALFGGSFWQYEFNTDKPYIDDKGRIRVNCHSVPSVWQQEAIAWSSGLVMRWFRDAFLDLDVELAKQLEHQFMHLWIKSKGYSNWMLRYVFNFCRYYEF